jgi:copper(I)-binding protein
VREAWARATILTSRPGVAYATIESVLDDRLVEVSAPVANRVMIHAMKSIDGISRMKHLRVLEILAGQSIILAPGSMHFMLMGMQRKLIEGTTFPVTLTFEKAGEITVEVSVLGIAAVKPQKTAQ